MNPNSSPSTEPLLCPYCGHVQNTRKTCEQCRGLFEPLSRMATQIAMGPWYIRDNKMPFAPGCSYEMMLRKAQSGQLKANTIIRGPSTHQFWMYTHQVPGIAHLLGICHQCSAKVPAQSRVCPDCHATFDTPLSRNELGLQYPTENAIQQAQKQLEQIRSGQVSQSPMPAFEAPTPVPPPQQQTDQAIDLISPAPAPTPLPVSSPSNELPPKSQVTHKTAPVKVKVPQPKASQQPTSKFSITVIAMVLCIVVLSVLILMLYMNSQKPSNTANQSPRKHEPEVTGVLQAQTPPQTKQDQAQPVKSAPPATASPLNLNQTIRESRQLEQSGQLEQALAKLREYAQTQSDGKLPSNLETEIKRIEQKIARKKAASFFSSH